MSRCGFWKPGCRAGGASGRNGGHCCFGGAGLDPSEIRDRFGEEVTRQNVNTQRESIDLVDELSVTHNLDIDKHGFGELAIAHIPKAVDWLREEEFESLNIDLIYGLPYQTAESFEQTLDEIIELNPDRLAVFSYAHVPWIKPAQKILTDDILPGPEMKLQLLKLTIEKLTEVGYVYVGMDHFAKAEDELAVAQRKKTLQRNFQGYSTFGGADILSFGMSAISQIPGAYWQNLKELGDYTVAVERDERPITRGYLLTSEDLIRREVIMRLMCHLELDYGQLSKELDIDFSEFFASSLESLEDMEADELLVRHDDRLLVTDLGRLVIRNIAMRFDTYQKVAAEQRFSKTI